jgi:ATP-dependent DNA helicase DinG
VVAVLDPRLTGSSYARFIAASLPPMWRTTDRGVVLAALRRLAGG